MASFTFNPLHQKQLFSIPLCKCPSNLFKFHSSSHVLSLTSNTHSPTQTILSPLLVVRANVSQMTQMDAKPSTAEKHSKDTINHRGGKEAGSGFSHFRSKDRSLAEKSVENDISSIVEDILEKNVTKDRQIEKILDFRRRVEKGSGVSSMRSKKPVKNNVSAIVEDILEKSVKKDRPTEKRLDSRGRSEIGSGFSSMRSKKPVKNDVSAIVGDILEKSVKKDGQTEKSLDFRRRVEKGSGFSSMRSNDSSSAGKISSSMGGTVVNEKMNKKFKRGNDGKLGKEKIEKSSKKGKIDLPGGDLRVGLDMCSKKGDVLGAIELYDSAQREGIKMGQYHYAVLLYLCSSAATGVVQPAKSGSSSRSLSTVESTSEISEGLGEFGELGRIELNAQFSNDCSIAFGTDDLNGNSYLTSNGFSKRSPRVLDGLVHLRKNYRDSSNAKDGISGKEDKGIRVSVDLKRYALKKGFEIYEKMCLESVPMNEATLTSLARMAMSMGNGDMAFDTVKKMKELGISPRLRSYGPALSTFCNNGDIEKAFKVEEHMLENGVYPEEPELEALLRVSIESGRSDKVYYLLHKLRTSVRKISPSIANLIEKWFESEVASRVGKRKWEKKLISEAIENGGGGWHGQGWLGKGKWNVSRTSVGSDGLCKCCGEKLATIDLDPTETENFAKSVASIAIQRERNSSFQKFQKWLDYYGPFEAVVDGANVGLFSQRKFKPSKVNAVVNGIRQMLPSKKWPLIVLHNRRITGENMDKPVNEALVEKWKNGDALYATPTGSNDDWYWLYAAIKFKCLMVTNDEMRDHLFQLLGNDFFPKWKERHQVRFNFSETGPVFQMPPPCSVVIQESDKGHWHIPIISEHNTEEERTWLCVTRANSHKARQAFATGDEVKPQIPYQKKGHTSSDTQAETQIKLPPLYPSNREKTKYPSRDIYRNLRKALSAPVFSDHSSILPEIAAAEKFGDCVIDFQI